MVIAPPIAALDRRRRRRSRPDRVHQLGGIAALRSSLSPLMPPVALVPARPIPTADGGPAGPFLHCGQARRSTPCAGGSSPTTPPWPGRGPALAPVAPTRRLRDLDLPRRIDQRLLARQQHAPGPAWCHPRIKENDHPLLGPSLENVDVELSSTKPVPLPLTPAERWNSPQ